MRLLVALLLIFLLICGGLIITEQGILEISGLDRPTRALDVAFKNNCFQVTFAGVQYEINLTKWLNKLFPQERNPENNPN